MDERSCLLSESNSTNVVRGECYCCAGDRSAVLWRRIRESEVGRDRPPDSDVLVIREGYVRLDGWRSRAHVSSRMVSCASELVILLLIQ